MPAGTASGAGAGRRRRRSHLVSVGADDFDRDHVRVAHEAGGEGRGRRPIDLVGRSDLLDAPVVQDDEAVGERERLPLVVRHVHEGRAGLAMHAPELGLHLEADLEVEGGERLVQQEHLRPVHERPRERDPLQLPARELVRAPPLEALQADERERLGDPCPRRRRAGMPAIRRPKATFSKTSRCGNSVERWKTMFTGRRCGGRPRDVASLEQHPPLARAHEAGHDPQQGRLAAPRGPEQRDELALLDRQRDLVERELPPVAVRDVLENEAASPFAISALRPGSARPRRVRLPARSVKRKATTQSRSVISMSSVEMTLIDGSIVRRRLDQMNMGRVESEPITKNVMMNSSKESANASEVAPTRIGQICGSVTLPEDLERGGAEVGGGFLEGRVEPVEGRLGDQQEVREDVDEVRDRDRHERELEVDAAEEDEHGDADEEPRERDRQEEKERDGARGAARWFVRSRRRRACRARA